DAHRFGGYPPRRLAPGHRERSESETDPAEARQAGPVCARLPHEQHANPRRSRSQDRRTGRETRARRRHHLPSAIRRAETSKAEAEVTAVRGTPAEAFFFEGGCPNATRRGVIVSTPIEPSQGETDAEVLVFAAQPSRRRIERG